ncbi:1-acyl-sn-glycerol-3-phosphate acyltransferase 2 [Spathaspora sp. JA1]|nr:1-acyl-sn-glycerol-3-phosphate acyltransferase 2 [Spathaspora sp. JA1]
MGDRLVSNPAIIISNHTSLADYFIIHYLARVSVLGDYSPVIPSSSEKITLPVVNFFSWFLVWRVPTVKILLHMLKCDENWEIDQKSVAFVFSRLLKSKNSQWIVIFPEVNIWTKEGAGLQRQLSEKYFLPQFNHLLYPRFSSFFNVITALADIKPQPYSNLYDITILYTRRDSNEISYQPPTLLEFFSSKIPITVTINVKIRSVNRIPEKRHKLERYLEHLWRNKDKLIGQLKEESELQGMYSQSTCINGV